MPEILEPFPEIRELGADRLRQICDEWCRGPVASEFGIVGINVSPDCTKLGPILQLSASNYNRGDQVHFPVDRIVNYIIDQTFPEAEGAILKARLSDLRKKAGPFVFQRFVVSIDAFNMATRCPSCSHGLISQHRIFRGQQFNVDPMDPIACPRCGSEFTPQSKDFFPVMGLPGE